MSDPIIIHPILPFRPDPGQISFWPSAPNLFSPTHLPRDADRHFDVTEQIPPRPERDRHHLLSVSLCISPYLFSLSPLYLSLSLPLSLSLCIITLPQLPNLISKSSSFFFSTLPRYYSLVTYHDLIYVPNSQSATCHAYRHMAFEYPHSHSLSIASHFPPRSRPSPSSQSHACYILRITIRTRTLIIINAFIHLRLCLPALPLPQFLNFSHLPRARGPLGNLGKPSAPFAWHALIDCSIAALHGAHGRSRCTRIPAPGLLAPPV